MVEKRKEKEKKKRGGRQGPNSHFHYATGSWLFIVASVWSDCIRIFDRGYITNKRSFCCPTLKRQNRRKPLQPANKKTIRPAVTTIADRTGCQWPSRSSKVNDFPVIWKNVCHFLLVINSNLGPISHRLRDTAIYGLKPFIEIAIAYRKSPAPYSRVPSPIPYDLPLSHNTVQLAYHSALWPFKVIQSHRFSCHLKANMRLPISDQNSNVGPTSHRLATIHPWQTDGRQPCQ